MNVFSILNELESISGRNDKIALLKKHNKNDELSDLLNMALNFNHKFYIKKFEVKPTHTGNGKFHEEFMQLLESLSRRLITGNNSLSAVESFMTSCTEEQAKWYSRVIKKDLRAGLDIKTVNAAGFNIPIFEVMLAKDGNDNKKAETIVKSGVYCSPKLDGYRCIAICSYGDVTLYSRNGSEYKNFPTIIEALSLLCQDKEFVLDGEIMSNDFNAMQQSAFASVRGTAVGDVVYHVFGLITMKEWISDEYFMDTGDRLWLLNEYIQPTVNINKVNQVYVESMQTLLALQVDYESKGYEGLMALPNMPYYKGRKSNSLMKFKSMFSQDCKVVECYEGGGKYTGTFGGFKVLQEDGITTCDVGSGFDDPERDYIWSNQSDVIGRVAEIKYQELTPAGVMRFPIFLRWRSDKS